MNQLKPSMSLQLTEPCTKRHSGSDFPLPSSRHSRSLRSAQLTHRTSSTLATSRHYKAIQKDAEYN